MNFHPTELLLPLTVALGEEPQAHHFFFPFNYLFTCGCAGSSSLHLDFTCSERGCSLQGLPLLQSTGSVVVAWGLSCSKVCGIFPDQGLNRGPPHCKVDS